MTFAKPKIVLLMQEAITQLVDKTSPGKHWEMDQSNNLGLYRSTS